MSTDPTGVDLVSGVLTRLAEIEQLAERAKSTGIAFVWARRCGRNTLRTHLSESADPDRVLRLCRAHRQIVDACQGELSGDNGP